MTAGLRRAILYGVLAVCLCGYCWVEGRASEQTAEAVTNAQTVLKGSHAFLGRLRADSLRLVALTRSMTSWASLEGHWRHVADSLVADTLDTTGAVQTPNLPAATVALGKALAFCDAARAAADSARTILASDLAACRMRGDTLEQALGRLLKVRAPRWGFAVGPALLASPNGTAHAGFAVVWGYRF